MNYGLFSIFPDLALPGMALTLSNIRPNGTHAKIDPLLDEMLRNYPEVEIGAGKVPGNYVAQGRLMDFVALDVETANSDLASICQIGLVDFRDGHMVKSWEWLIDPEDYFDEINVSIHGIDETAVQVLTSVTKRTTLLVVGV